MMLDGVLPYPDEIGCIIHCTGEATEYRDARRRVEHPEEKRNNGKQHDPRKELGQCAYMLLSGLLYRSEWIEGDLFYPPEESDAVETEYIYFCLLQSISDLALVILDDLEIDTVLREYRFAWEGIALLAKYHGWDVAELIEDTCADFERKHLEPVGPDMRHGGKTA